MTSEARPPGDVPAIERLLGMRRSPGEKTACAGLEILARTLAGLASAEDKAAAIRHLQDCDDCAEVLLELARVEGAGIHPPEECIPAGVEGERRPFGARLRDFFGTPLLAPISAAFLLVVTFAVWWLVPRAPIQQGSGPGALQKGQGDALYVAVQRGQVQFVLKPEDFVNDGDSLGWFYSTDRAGYLAILFREEQGGVELIFPAKASQSAAISPGFKIPLEDGARVTAARGCEWLVAFFSDRPLEIAALRKALLLARGAAERCSLEVPFDQARSVQVFPLLRERRESEVSP